MLGKKKLTEVALPLDAINKASAPKVLFPMPYASSPIDNGRRTTDSGPRITFASYLEPRTSNAPKVPCLQPRAKRLAPRSMPYLS